MAEPNQTNNPSGAPAETPVTPRRKRREKTYVPGEQKKGLAEVMRILKERRLLRKDLKRKGIKSRQDFNMIAKSMGLTLDKVFPFLPWWRHLWGALLTGLGLKTLLAAAAALLTVVFLLSYITEEKGSFTINLTADMLKAGFVLYNNAQFRQPETRLFSEKLEQVNNITLSDIPTTVDDIDGPHNGKDYIAYTFYIRNEGDAEADYAWYMNFLAETMEVGQCVWVMLYEDGSQVIYAEPTSAGKAEELYGFKEAPFGEAAYAYDSQYYIKDGKYGLVTTAHVDETIVAQGLIEDVQPGEAHKYTVVIWVEGYDPECTDERFGGFAKYSMDFDNVSAEEDKHIFSGLYRTEYKNYGLNPDTLVPGKAPGTSKPAE